MIEPAAIASEPSSMRIWPAPLSVPCNPVNSQPSMIPAALMPHVARICGQVNVSTLSGSLTPTSSRMTTTNMATPRITGMIVCGNSRSPLHALSPSSPNV